MLFSARPSENILTHNLSLKHNGSEVTKDSRFGHPALHAYLLEGQDLRPNSHVLLLTLLSKFALERQMGDSALQTGRNLCLGEQHFQFHPNFMTLPRDKFLPSSPPWGLTVFLKLMTRFRTLSLVFQAPPEKLKTLPIFSFAKLPVRHIL